MSTEKSGLEELRIDRTRAKRPASKSGWIIAVVLLLLCAAIFWFWRNYKGAASVRTIAAMEAGAGPQTVLNASGYVTAQRQATVASKITGQMIEIHFEEGQKVNKGDILARVDPSNIQTGLALAEAQLKVAQVGLTETKTQLDQAERDLNRAHSLATNDVVSPAEVERAQAQQDMLRARMDRLRAEITVAERQIATWQQQLEDTIIRAPFDGVVVAKSAQPGEIISPLSAGGGFTRTGVCTLVDMTSLEVDVDVNENYINRVTAGQVVEAKLDAYTDWKIPAKVIAIIPTADRQKASVKVRIGFDQLDPRILPDMGVKVSFKGGAETAVGEGAVVIPKTALTTDGGHTYIWVAQDGKAERREIKVAQERGEEVVIASSLSRGEKVIVENQAGLKTGDRIQESKL